MIIDSLTISGFRCFGPTPTTITLSNDITGLIGANGSGKTACLLALTRMFGLTQKQRTIIPNDFHVSGNGDDEKSLTLWIEVTLKFPELGEETQSRDAIPPTFNHMVVEEPNSPPFCRIRLEATWVKDSTIEGDIEQHIHWITTADVDIEDKHRQPLRPHDRGLVQVHYLPASRGATGELMTAVKTIIGRLLAAADWSDEVKSNIENAGNTVQAQFEGEGAVQQLNHWLQRHWGELYDGGTDAKPELRILSRRFEEVIRKIDVLFHPNENGGSRELEELSEGQKALFYFTAAIAAFNVEQEARKACAENSGDSAFHIDKLSEPALTLFAVEEPENHLAPFYLSRIIKQLRTLTDTGMAQALITSHSPAILGRIEPEAVRHFRLDSVNRTTQVSTIQLPENDEQAAKYVRGAVMAYPELYFARFVILAEGDSEEIVLPRIAEAMGLDIDPSFVSVVPLGGRHVNHFWRLLETLKIPYATLLDLDLGRNTGGWARIHYVLSQLLIIGVDRSEILTVTENGQSRIQTDEEFAGIPKWDNANFELIKQWLNMLEGKGVFFSAPLDLDLTMLEQFEVAYQASADGSSPRSTAEQAVSAVLSTGIGAESLYLNRLPSSHALLHWYRYLFLTHSKPATHLKALANIAPQQLQDNSPEIYKRLLNHVATALGNTQQ